MADNKPNKRDQNISRFQIFQSLLAILPIVRNKIGSYLKKAGKELKGPSKKPLFCLTAFLIVSLFGFLVFSFGLTLKSPSLRDFSFLTATAVKNFSSQDLFVTPVKNFLMESPEMSFVQKNSIIGVSSPVMITSQVLGTMFEETEIRREIIEHIVEPGDTLSSISTNFNISLDTILWANDLNKKSVIKTGQKLVILPISGVLYLVKKDDTLSRIAETYKGKVEEITAFNKLLDKGDIFVGDVLIIPNGKMPARIPQVSLTPLAESYFIFPCEGKISQGLHPFNAIDVANKCGKPVVAAASGQVLRAGPIWIGGNIITISHSNGVVTYYGHLSKIAVRSGQMVNTGDIIGYIGNTGYTLGATGCHLHFEVRGAKNFLSKYPVGSYLSWKK